MGGQIVSPGASSSQASEMFRHIRDTNLQQRAMLALKFQRKATVHRKYNVDQYETSASCDKE
jgi:hypothetical protein